MQVEERQLGEGSTLLFKKMVPFHDSHSESRNGQKAGIFAKSIAESCLP